jgi:hypothetical protein
VTALNLYGAVADAHQRALDGADLSLFIGLPVAAGLYLWFARSIDVEAERRIAEREAEELEELAAEHAMPTASV